MKTEKALGQKKFKSFAEFLEYSQNQMEVLHVRTLQQDAAKAKAKGKPKR